MKALVVYESMFGNTREVAYRVASGLELAFEVTVAHVSDVTPEMANTADFLVVGGPTHVHGMASARTRDAAKKMADKEGSGLELEPRATGSGLREWLATLDIRRGVEAAVFDTRNHGPGFVTGRASRGIARRLRKRGANVVATESFFVAKGGHVLDADEESRAEVWAAELPRRLGVLSSAR
jgi:hypothetical protein